MLKTYAASTVLGLSILAGPMLMPADAHHYCGRHYMTTAAPSGPTVMVPFIEAPLVFATGLAEFGVSIPEFVLTHAVPVPYVGRIPSPYHP